eukprot:6212633-Pleurochrysis_carterae.AAC.3
MYSTNGCEYEPWQNPTERHMRTLQEPMRVMHERGGAGEEYWENSMTQASPIPNVTHHRWGAPDENMTTHERKTGRHPSVSHFRPMFLPGLCAPP